MIEKASWEERDLGQWSSGGRGREVRTGCGGAAVKVGTNAYGLVI